MDSRQSDEAHDDMESKFNFYLFSTKLCAAVLGGTTHPRSVALLFIFVHFCSPLFIQMLVTIDHFVTPIQSYRNQRNGVNMMETSGVTKVTRVTKVTKVTRVTNGRVSRLEIPHGVGYCIPCMAMQYSTGDNA